MFYFLPVILSRAMSGKKIKQQSRSHSIFEACWISYQRTENIYIKINSKRKCKRNERVSVSVSVVCVCVIISKSVGNFAIGASQHLFRKIEMLRRARYIFFYVLAKQTFQSISLNERNVKQSESLKKIREAGGEEGAFHSVRFGQSE